MTDRIDRCPTCGSIVRIVSADDDLGGDVVTSRYESMQDEDLRHDVDVLLAERVRAIAEDAELQQANEELRERACQLIAGSKKLSADRHYWYEKYMDVRDRIQKLVDGLP